MSKTSPSETLAFVTKVRLEYIAFAVCVLQYVMNIVASEGVDQRGNRLVLVAVGLLLVTTVRNVSKARIVLIVPLLIGFMLMAWSVRNWDLLALCLFAINANKLSLKVLAAIQGTFFLLSFLTTAIPAALGLSATVVIEADTRMDRASWGYLHPNYLGLVMLVLILDWLLLFCSSPDENDLNLKRIVPVVVPMFVIWEVSNSRAAFAAALCLVLAAVVCGRVQRFGRRASRFVSGTALASWIAMPVLTFILGMAYDSGNHAWYMLDQLLSRRLAILHSYLTTIPFRPFSTDLEQYEYLWSFLTVSGEGFVLDNAYLRLVYICGVVPAAAIFVAVAVLLAVQTARGEVEPMVMGLFIVLLWFGLVENSNFNVAVNILWVGVASAAWSARTDVSLRVVPKWSRTREQPVLPAS